MQYHSPGNDGMEENVEDYATLARPHHPFPVHLTFPTPFSSMTPQPRTDGMEGNDWDGYTYAGQHEMVHGSTWYGAGTPQASAVIGTSPNGPQPPRPLTSPASFGSDPSQAPSMVYTALADHPQTRPILPEWRWSNTRHEPVALYTNFTEPSNRSMAVVAALDVPTNHTKVQHDYRVVDVEAADEWLILDVIDGHESYKCRWAKCGKSLSHGLLKARLHIHEHKGTSQPLQCVDCGQRFVTEYVAQRHRDSREKKYKCDRCDKYYAREDYLTTHKKTCRPRNFGV